MSIWDALIGRQNEVSTQDNLKYVTIDTGSQTEATDKSYPHQILGVETVSSGTDASNALNYYAVLNRYMQGQVAKKAARSLPTLTLSALSGEAGRASLDELRDLWRARWGDKWVKREEIDGEFFEVAAVRLLSGNRLETHSLGDGVTVYRLL